MGLANRGSTVSTPRDTNAVAAALTARSVLRHQNRRQLAHSSTAPAMRTAPHILKRRRRMVHEPHCGGKIAVNLRIRPSNRFVSKSAPLCKQKCYYICHGIAPMAQFPWQICHGKTCHGKFTHGKKSYIISVHGLVAMDHDSMEYAAIEFSTCICCDVHFTK